MHTWIVSRIKRVQKIKKLTSFETSSFVTKVKISPASRDYGAKSTFAEDPFATVALRRSVRTFRYIETR